MSDATNGYIYDFLETSTGGRNIAASTTTEEFMYYWQVEAGQTACIARVNVLLVDDTQAPTKFGGITALTNGLKVQVLNSADEVLFDYLDGETLTMNAEWALLAGTDNPVTAAAGDDVLQVRWTLEKAGKALYLWDQMKLAIITQDNFDGVTDMKAMVQGYRGNHPSYSFMM